MSEQLRKQVEAELDRNEQLLWLGQPDSADLLVKMVFGWTVVLAAVFYESVSLVLNSNDSSDSVLALRVVALALIAAFGAAMIILLPRHTARIFYAVSTKRVCRLDLNRSVHKSVLSRLNTKHKQIVHETRSTPFTFWFSIVSNTFVVLIWANLFLPSMAAHFDVYLALSLFLLALIGMLYAYDELLLPMAKYRNPSGTLFSLDEKLTYIQSVPLKDVAECRVRKRKGGVGDVFLLSPSAGCLRIKSVKDVDQLETFLPSTAFANAGNLLPQEAELEKVEEVD